MVVQMHIFNAHREWMAFENVFFFDEYFCLVVEIYFFAKPLRHFTRTRHIFSLLAFRN